MREIITRIFLAQDVRSSDLFQSKVELAFLALIEVAFLLVVVDYQLIL